MGTALKWTTWLLSLGLGWAMAEEKPLKVHFVASAWAAFHGLANQCGDVLEADPRFGPVTVTHPRIWPLHAVVSKSNEKIQFYTKVTKVDSIDVYRANLEAADFDVLVAGVQLEMILKESLEETYREAFAYLSRQAEAKDAKLVIAAYAGEEMNKGEEAMAKLREMAAAVDAAICPWWGTMKAVGAGRPDAQLFDPKVGGHPGGDAVYPCAFALYFAVTGTPPREAPLPLEIRGWRGEEKRPIDEAEAEALREIAWDAWRAASVGG